MAAAAAVSRPTVWAEDFGRIMNGHLEDPTLFTNLLTKIVKARQDGKFPLSEEILAPYKQDGESYNDAVRSYRALENADGLASRCSLVSSNFFQGIANTDGCELSEAKKTKAKETYLIKMLKATKTLDLLTNPTIKDWLEKFAIASYSAVIDAIDELYEGVDPNLKKILEGTSSQIAIKLFDGFQESKYTTDDLQLFIKMIENECVNASRDNTHKLEFTNAFLLDIYSEYKKLLDSFSSLKHEKFWKVRVLSLKAFLKKLI